MRLNAFVAACAIFLSTEASLRFTEPVWRPDLGLSVPVLREAQGLPLDPPKAASYLVSEKGGQRLEDRFEIADLWLNLALRGRWIDSSGNQLFLARLGVQALSEAPGTVMTRTSFYAYLAEWPLNPKDARQRDRAVMDISPIDVERAVRPRRSRRKNLLELTAYATTNENALVYAFRPRNPERGETADWYLAVLLAADGESMGEVRARFDEDFLDRISVPARRARPSPVVPSLPAPDLPEGELLRRDLARSVANYDAWQCTSAADVLILDNLDAGTRKGLVPALTNGLARLRREYARTVPSPLVATNQLAVVRIFRSREEYLAYVGVEQKWTSALWSPLRRELVLHHQDGEVGELLKIVWHEAFHQYLSYAGSLISASPWFNEGHADLFANSHFDHRGSLVFDRDPAAAAYVKAYAEALAKALPDLLQMDYREFYAGAQDEVLAKYRLAWSLAYFLEVGAPGIRFQPYADLRSDYMENLVRTRDMSAATRAVLPAGEMEKFIAAWLDFWRRQ
ncbi:MAG: hypothetical protein ACI4Q3_01615 [Kiritimatiellia bacterium]